jgi:DNA-binding SARP family transcriptional activator
LPAEIVLCAGFVWYAGYVKTEFLEEEKLLKFVSPLAEVLRRSESSISKKLQTLTARTRGRRTAEQEFMRLVESDPTQLEKFIEIAVQGARQAGLSSRDAAKLRFR